MKLDDLDGVAWQNPGIFEDAIKPSGTSFLLQNDSNVNAFNAQYLSLSMEIDEHMSDGASISIWINFGDNSGTATILSNYKGSDGDLEPCWFGVGFTIDVTPDNSLRFYYASNDDNYAGRKTAINKIREDV
ncbi:hypothetical protein [Ascidiimonas aurantiaca]|uniref:hypothetical protein n=1 Tax=Ascidiimonas aurantiaca TaxID=1685432 RepID=UPI0030ECF0DF